MKSKLLTPPVVPAAANVAAPGTQIITVEFSQPELKAIRRCARKLGISVEDLLIRAVAENLASLGENCQPAVPN